MDELLAGKQLIGDRRLSDALAECDEQGWDALPLAAKQMSQLFPHLLGNEEIRRTLAREEPPRAILRYN